VKDSAGIGIRGGVNESRHGRNSNYTPAENTEWIYLTMLGSMSETSWSPSSKMSVTITSDAPVHLLKVTGGSGSVEDFNLVNDIQENFTITCN
jgi:hypothetical protein